MSILLQRRWRNQRAAASLNRQRTTTQATAAPTAPTTELLTAGPTSGAQGAAGEAVDDGSLVANSITGGPMPASSQRQRPMMQQQASMQLHNLRPSSQVTGSVIGGESFPLVSQSGAAKLGTCDWQAQLQQVEPEQSALDLAQSAAARVSETAMAAAAKFKMLRSNTLAAAFGRATAGTVEPDGAPMDLLATRTKDERVVNTLSPAGRLNRS